MASDYPDFARATEPRPRSDGDYTIRFGADWLQGPGVYGGVVFAALVRTFRAVVPEERVLRSFQCEVLAPVRPDTDTQIRYEILREGRNVTYMRGSLVQESPCATATAAFGAPRSRDSDFCSIRAPEVPPAADVPPISALPDMPAFARNHVSYRVALGDAPMSGADRAYTGGWVSLKRPGNASHEALALALIDTWWPAWFVTVESPRHMSTMAFNAYLFDLDFDPSQPVLKTSETVVASDGYADQNDRLFAPDGRLIATSRQLVALIE